jgi:hypothetical protein
MDFSIFSYRFSEEIIRHPNHVQAFQEVSNVIRECPLFTYPNKSAKNRRLDVVQQLLNTYFDRRFFCDFGWEYHPNATIIPNSDLAADYKKTFNGLRIQSEVQFGNMARWYSDIFKFQTAYSQDLIDLGLCIVPMSSLAARIDSNVANYERCIRELPSAKLSITLPILIIGLREGRETKVIDVSRSSFANVQEITGKGRSQNRYRIVNGILNNTPIHRINAQSPVGPVANIIDTADIDER